MTPDKRRALIRFSFAVIVRTVAFAALIPKWNTVHITVFWVCLVGSAFLEPKPKQKIKSNLFDVRTPEGRITFVQMMAAMVLLDNASLTLPKGWFESVIHNPWNLIACWILFVLVQLRSYVAATKESKEELPTSGFTAYAKPGAAG